MTTPLPAPLPPVGEGPVACIVIGMAGSGKTTLLQRLAAHLHQHTKPSYVINLDPAVRKVPYGAHIDIRDTVNYKEVMKQYKLGPNGGILTSLNLFATRFDQVLDLVDKRRSTLDYVLVDTPGQIEIFTWSASGSVVSDAIASSMPTVLIYVIDTPRCTNPTTFMSNMLYACSVMYKSKLPLILAFNKDDVSDPQFAFDWMANSDLYQDALRSNDTFMAEFVRSMGEALEEFYQNLRAVSVSAVTGHGMPDFFDAVDAARAEYDTHYRKMYEERRAKLDLDEQQRQSDMLRHLQQDLATRDASAVPPPAEPEPNQDDIYDDEDDDDDEEDHDPFW